MSLSKRTVLVGLAAAAAAGLVPDTLRTILAAPGGATRIRHDATSSDGKAMLRIYAEGVKALKAAPSSATNSWTFQWYTHWVKGSTTKTREIAGIFGSKHTPARTQAELMWGTCRAHDGNEAQEQNFLPWHRAFVFYFESIIRHVSGKDEFTLPYWDYTTNSAIPPEFRMPKDPLYKWLHVAQRNPGVNQGKPIANPGVLNLNSLKQTDYLPRGVLPGFDSDLDNGLHGNVHVLTGNDQNMGQIPFAANDPVFWIHHANIDRMWAAWNALGGRNPDTSDWKSQRHAFVDATGTPAALTNAEVTTTALLNYTYDTLPAGQPILVAETIAPGAGAETMAAPAPPPPVAQLQQRLTLGPSTTTVKLQPTPTLRAEKPEAGGASGKTYLVISDIQTNVQPGVVYSVYASPEGGDQNEKTFVGTFQFFDAKPEGSRRRFVFDVTDIAAKSSAKAPLTYEIVPSGTPDEKANPVVGSMTLVRP